MSIKAKRILRYTLVNFALIFMLSATCRGQQITIHKDHVSLVEIFKEIKKQTGYGFIYTIPQIRKAKSVRVNINKGTLNDVLKQCFSNQPFGYLIKDKNIIVQDEKEASATPQATPQHPLTGTITNQDGLKLIGASIRLVNTHIGVATNAQGQYNIHVSPGDRIKVTMIGYQDQIIRIADQTVLHIVLTAKESEMDDIVIVGYGEQKREDLTNSVSSIDSKEITEMPTTNLSQVFAGRIPGVLARTTTGSPGDESATLLIRTTDQSQSPLLVIDGVPSGYTNLNVLDPNEVSSISVLKDNAATAVYGARAANGVILVTTKRGKTGKPQFNFISNITWSSPTKVVDLLDGYGYAVAQNEYNINGGLEPLFTSKQLDTIRRQLAPYRYANTDWMDLLNKRGFVQNYNINVRGGTDAVRYFISGSYTNQGGMFPTNYYKRYTLKSNLDIKLSKQFKAAINLNYRNAYKQEPGGSAPYNAMSAAADMSPLIAPYMPDGSFGGTSSGSNPLASVSSMSGYDYNNSNYLTANGRLTWESPFIKGLSAYANFFTEKYFYRSKNYVVPVPIFNLDPASESGYKQVAGNGNPSVTDGNRDATSYTIDAAITYKRQFHKHHIEALALYTVAERKTNSNSDKRLNLIAPGLDIIDLGSSENESTSGSRSQEGRASYVGRIDYSYDHRFLAEFSFRTDGSSKFPPGHQWGFFPGGSLGWLMSKEHFLKSLSNVVSLLKVRGSIGLAGDDNIGSNTYYYLYSIANTGIVPANGYVFGDAYQPTFILANKTVPNEDITWAKNLQMNFGVDATLWQGRLGITFDVYQKNRYDILRTKTYDLPATFGIDGPIQNYARMRDRGFELSLTSDNRLTKDWRLSINANITSVKTRYIDWGTATQPGYQRYEGHSTNTLVGYKSLGIFQTADEIAAWPVDQDGLSNKTIKAGDIKYADLDGDGKISAFDQVWVDNYGFPPINYGFGCSLSYKKLTLSALFNGAAGGYMQYSGNIQWKYIYDHSWRPDNKDAFYPRLGKSANNDRVSDATLTKSDYLRLRDLRLSYTLPETLLSQLKLRQVDVYLQGSNLLTFTKVLAGIDPENPTLGTAGTNGGFYPAQRNIGFGVNIKF